jgi:hypothetical protein
MMSEIGKGNSGLLSSPILQMASIQAKSSLNLEPIRKISALFREPGFETSASLPGIMNPRFKIFWEAAAHLCILQLILFCIIKNYKMEWDNMMDVYWVVFTASSTYRMIREKSLLNFSPGGASRQAEFLDDYLISSIYHDKPQL